MVLHLSGAQWVPQPHSGVWGTQGGHLAIGKLLVGIMWGHGEVTDFYSAILLMLHSNSVLLCGF